MEKARHVLLLREKLQEEKKTHELTKLDKEASNMSKQQRSLRDKERGMTEKGEGGGAMAAASMESECDHDREVLQRCLKLLMLGKAQPTQLKVSVTGARKVMAACASSR